MTKLVCDRCGKEVTEREVIAQILAGADAWIESAKARGAKPRGIFPCKEYRNCGGEMVVVDK